MVKSLISKSNRVPWFCLFLLGAYAQQPLTDDKSFFGGNTTLSNNTAYYAWAQAKGSFYDNAIFIPLPASIESGAAIHWKVVEEKIYLAVAARALGWVGFGIADAGGMKGADIVYYTASTNQLVDSFVLDVFEEGPTVDGCQNWKLQNSSSTGGFLIFEAVRDLDTGDSQDRQIINDADAGNVPPHRVIAAWGDSEQISYHGPTNRVRSAVRFFGQPDDAAVFYQTMQEQADGYFDIRAVNYTIKQLETEYKHFCFSRDALIALGAPANKSIQVIGYEPIVSNGSEPFVHHFLVYGTQNASEGIPYTGNQCETSNIYQVAYVWAPGESALSLPDNVGAPYMDEAGFNALSLEIHYNNPDLVANVVDNSGVRLYYTTKIRDDNLFVFQFGDPFVKLKGTLVGGGVETVETSSVKSLALLGGSSLSGVYRHSFDCPTACTALTLPRPVTVVREYLHMHKTGIRVSNHHIRNGAVIRTGYVDFWDFFQQGNQAVVQQPFEVLPGDTFQTRCYYEPSNTTVFGLSSQNEMCIAYLFFYQPRTYGPLIWDACGFGLGFDLCDENHTKEALYLTTDLGRVFGNASQNCTLNSSTEVRIPSGNQTAFSTSGAVAVGLRTFMWVATFAVVLTMW